MTVRKGSLFKEKESKEVYKVKKITKHYFYMVEMENINPESPHHSVTLNKNNLTDCNDYIKLKRRK